MLSRANIRAAAAAIAALIAAIAVGVAAPVSAPAAPMFRAFSPTSPWNVPAAPDSIASSNPYSGQFTSYSSQLEISGLPGDAAYASPVFFASPGDPATANVDLTTDWSPTKDLKWDHKAIPVPSGAYPAPGSDGHMTIVSADGTKDWEFWRATKISPSGITAAVIVQWNLTGQGYSSSRDENSARGSGTPLISTSLRAEEALNGITHALGITVPSVSGDYIYPVATHSDGDAGSNAIKYGMRFVLRSDYPVPGSASVGERNIIAALKTYGAYVVDQGASFELDADSTHPGIWAQTGLSPSSLSIRGSDMRPARAGVGGAVPPPEAASTRPHRRRVILRVARHRLHVGRKLRLRGRVRVHVPAGRKVRIQVRVGRHWHRLRRKPIQADGTFRTNPRLKRSRHAAWYGVPRLRLKHVHLRPGVRVLKLRAVVRGVGHSNVVRVRVRR
jgi:hypothetical protein